MTRPVVVELRADGKGVISTFRTTTREAERMQRQFDGSSRSAQNLSRNTDSATRSFRGFSVAAAAGLAALGVREIARRADEMTRLNARLRLVTDTTQEYRRAQQSVSDIANESGRQLGAVGELYVRLEQSLADYGAQAGEIETITRAVTQSMRVSGASASESAGAIRQLSQSFAAGVLRGDEFNSVNEQAPRLMQALADSIGVTRGELRGMAEQGQLTSDILRTALVDQAGEIAAESAQIPSTLSEAWTRMSNSLTQLIGNFDEAAGSSQGFAGVMDGVADRIDSVADWIADNMLNIRLAGIAMVRGMLLAFEELKGGLTLYRGVATEAIQFIANTWNSALATMNEGLAEFVRRAGNALGALPGFDDLGQRIGFMADALEANAAAARENVIQGRSLGEVYSDTRARVNEAKDGIRNITDAMADDAIAARQATDATEELGSQTEETGKTVTEEVAKMSEETADFLTGLQDLRDQLDGPQAQAQRQFIRRTQEATQLLITGRIDVEAYGEAIRLFHQELNEASEEFETFDGWLDSITDRMTESQRTAQAYADSFVNIASAVTQAATGMDFFGQSSGQATSSNSATGDLARSLASAISATDGENLGDSIGDSLRAYGTDGITRGLQDSFKQAMEALELDMSEGELQGYTLALGEAVGGNMGAAIGSAIGTAIGAYFGGTAGAQAGAAIGNAIGGLFDEQKKHPRFDFGQQGPLQERKPSVTPEYFRTALQTQVAYGYTGLDDQTISELVRGVQDFDRALASAIEGSDYGEATREALMNFSFISDEQGLSLDEMMQARMDAVIDVLDWAAASIVMRGDTIEDQMQRLASVIDIEQLTNLGGGLGLSATTRTRPTYADIPAPIDGPGQVGDFVPGLGRIGEGGTINVQTGVEEYEVSGLQNALLLTEELSRAGETLAETFNRLVTVTDLLDTGAALAGTEFEGSRADLVRFGDELNKVFGDDLDRLTDGLNRIYGTFFTDEERLGVQADQARAQATSLLGQAGIDVEADMLTLEGFRELWDDLFLTLGPENQALLIEAGTAVADLIDAEEQLAETRTQAQREAADTMNTVMSDLRGMQWSPLRLELYRINQATQEATAALRAAGASEEDYQQVLQRHTLQVQALAGTLRASLTDMRDQLFGNNGIGSSMQSTASSIGNSMQSIQTSMIDAIAGVQDWLDSSLLGSNSPLLPQEQLDAAGSQFWDAISAAQGGDAEAASQLPQLADQFLDQASSFWGTSTAEYQDIWNTVRDAMQGVADMNVAEAAGPPTFGQQQAIVDATQSTEMTALEQARLAGRMVDEIGVLARISGDSPANIAEELDIPIGQLIEAVTGELPQLTGEALDSHFNELVAETDAQLSALGRIEGVLDDIRKLLGGQGAPSASDPPPLPDMPLPGDQGDQPPPGYASGGWASGLVMTGEQGRELILDNHVSEFFRRNGVPVQGGGSDPQARALLSKIEQRLARMEEQDRTLTAEQIRAIREGDSNTALQLNELTQIEERKARQNKVVRRAHP